MSQDSGSLEGLKRKENNGEGQPHSQEEGGAAGSNRKRRGEEPLLLPEDKDGDPAESQPSSPTDVPSKPPGELWATQCCPSALACPIAHCCHGGAKMAALAYNRGKREINHYFSMRNAKALALGAVVLLAACHAASRPYRDNDTCEYLLSRGRFLGENVWQPHSCMMHKYKNSEAKECLANKHIAFVGDSRIRQLFYSFIKTINPHVKEEGKKHENIPFEDKVALVRVDFLWHPEVNNSMKQCFRSWIESSVSRPNIIMVGAATWSMKIHNGSSEALSQYKNNVTTIAPILEMLAENSEVYWALQDPVYEPLLSDNRKMITNKKIDAYNEVAIGILNSSTRNTKSKIKLFGVSKLISEETIQESVDGLHLPDASRDISAMVLMNAYCNKILKPVDGSCCQPLPPLTIIQKLTACFFAASIFGFIILSIIHRINHHKNKLCMDLECGEEKKPSIVSPTISMLEIFLLSFCKLGLIMAYFYLCDRADLFMKENKFYTHSSFFIPLIYILVLGIFYTENTKEYINKDLQKKEVQSEIHEITSQKGSIHQSHVQACPDCIISMDVMYPALNVCLDMPTLDPARLKCLNREQTDEWKGWMQLVILIYHISGASTFLPVYMHIRVLVAAYLFQTGYGHFSFFWIKGDFGIYRLCQVIFRLNFLVVVLCIVMDRPYQFYYFVPLVTFWFFVIYTTMVVWPQILQKQANGNCFWHFGLLLKLIFLLMCICFLTYSQASFEKIFSLWPLSKLFQLNGNVYEWWFRWKLDRYAVFHGMLFAFVYLALQKRHMLSEGKGESLFSNKVSNILLFISVVSFLTYSIWASSCKNKTECNELHPSVSMIQILAFILIRNIPGYARSVYSSFFSWFGKISLELFICQYHIWLAADTKGILVLIPGNPMFNIIVSTFIFVCVSHEISQITNDLAQVMIPKDSPTLLKRLLCIVGFFSGLLLLSAAQEQLRH